jgi:hypothetical protein
MLNKIKFSFKVADKQVGLFTPNHTLFKCKIKVDGCQFTFPYQCNTAYNTPNLLDCMCAIISDMDCYDISRDVVGFCNEFGYDDEKGINAYKDCKKISKALHRLFTDEEIAEIGEELMEEGY